MTRPLFFAEPQAVSGDEIVLDGAEGRHAAVVRRVRVGELVDVADGMGAVAECRVARVGDGLLALEVTGRRTEPVPQPRLVVVQALAKGGRDEEAVAAMTEVGVDEVVPWSAARSIVQWQGPRGERSRERWHATAREAAKQSRRARIPVVAGLADTAAVATLVGAAASAAVLHESAATSLAELALPATGDVVLVVGPEGGITDDELAAFAAAGAPAYRLGPSVLRSGTAGVVAAGVVLSRCRW